MRSIPQKRSWFCMLAVFAVAMYVPKVSAQATKQVDCDHGDSITATLQSVHRGDTVVISGTCTENVLISDTTGHYAGVTLDGQGTATIAGPGPTLNAVELTDVSGFTIRGLTITGGNDGISI